MARWHNLSVDICQCLADGAIQIIGIYVHIIGFCKYIIIIILLRAVSRGLLLFEWCCSLCARCCPSRKCLKNASAKEEQEKEDC